MARKQFCDTENMPSMDALMGESAALTPKYKDGQIIQGRIAQKTEKGVYVDFGYKSEHFIESSEIRNWNDLKEGDTVDLYLEQIEDEDSNLDVSIEKAETQKVWNRIIADNKEGGLIHGVIKSRVKGGLIVDVGVDAFLPGSQIDLGPVRNLDDYLGLEEDFQILKIDLDRRNIVLSRRELLEAKRNAQRDELLKTLEKGQIRHGVVKNITSFGAFVDLNGMDGLLHVGDMSWGRVTHPSEFVHQGQEIDVMILDVDREAKRVSLGLKQKEGNPWDTAELKYPKGSMVHGKVVNVVGYGAFVELEPGIEGLIHSTELSWTKKLNTAREVIKEGDEVDALVLDVNRNDSKISLSLRQTQPNPWEIIKEKFPQGTRIKGKVRNMTDYGAFVQIQDDIDGMIHVSDMCWTRRINRPSEMLQKGQEVEAVVVDVDVAQQRISLSMKLLKDDPWENLPYKVGDIVEGKVTKLAHCGVFVELDNGIDGLIFISEFGEERGAKLKEITPIGSTVKCRVKSISAAEKRIGLSLKLEGDDNFAAELATGDSPAFGGVLDEAFKAAEENTEAAPATEE